MSEPHITREERLENLCKEVLGVAKPFFVDASVFGHSEAELQVARPSLSQWKSIVHKALALQELDKPKPEIVGPEPPEDKWDEQAYLQGN
jgi:hypothetical protein